MADDTNTNATPTPTPSVSTPAPAAAPAAPAVAVTTSAVPPATDESLPPVSAASVQGTASAVTAEVKSEVKAEVKDAIAAVAPKVEAAKTAVTKVIAAAPAEAGQLVKAVEVDQDKIHSAIQDFLTKKNYLFEDDVKNTKEWGLIHFNAFVAYCRNKLGIVHPAVPNALEHVYDGIKNDADWVFSEAKKIVAPAATSATVADATKVTQPTPTAQSAQPDQQAAAKVPTSTFSVNTAK